MLCRMDLGFSGELSDKLRPFVDGQLNGTFCLAFAGLKFRIRDLQDEYFVCMLISCTVMDIVL